MINEILDVVFTANFFQSGIRLAIPLVLACVGGVLAERSGVLTMSLEGMMLMGALCGFTGAYFSHSAWIGLLAAILGSMLFGLIHAFTSVILGVSQVVVSVALNILGVGLTSSLFYIIFGNSTNQLRSVGFEKISIPLLSKIPIIGSAFFDQTIIGYLAFILIPLTWWFLFKTTTGLKIRAVGEYPKAAETMGVNVLKLRFLCVLYASVLAGVAGAAISITGLNTFIPNLTAGRGFIAFAAIIFGKYNPIGAATGAFLFGFADCLQLNIQSLGINIPYQIPLMMPYIITLVVLFMVGAGGAPKSSGSPYFPDGE